MSRVFIAQETSLGRSVVVKVLPPEMAGSVNVERFRREIQLAARLQHACIVPLLSAGVADGMAYYTMPLVDGESLRRRIARGGELPVNEAVRFLRDVAEALSYAHEQGVIHRDIKPDNILLTKHHALVTDFGVAKALSASTLGDAVTSIGVAIGTPAYMAPEQAAGDPHVDHRADIYAFGVTAYEMLSGEKPFVGRSPQAVMAAQATQTPKPLESLRATVPRPLAELVGRCLAKRAADRPQSADELLEALEAMATPTGLTPASLSPARKSRRAWTIAVAAVVVAAAIAAGAVARMKTSSAPRLNPKRVVVAEFENQTGDSSLAVFGRMAADYLTQGLAQISDIQVASLSAGPITGDAGSRPSASGAARATAAALAARAGTVVWGTYYKDGDTLRIQPQITDANTGRIVRPLAVVLGPATDRTRLIQALRSQVAGAIAAIFSVPLQGYGGSLPNWDAYQEFAEAQKYFPTANFPQALIHLKRSIAADSTFVTPLAMLAAIYTNTGDWKRLDSLERRVAPMRLGRSGTDAELIEWITAVLHRDFLAQIATMERSAARDSSDIQFYEIAVANNWLNRPRAALTALRTGEASAARLAPFYWTQRTISSHGLGDFKTELAEARRYRLDAPQATGALTTIGRAAAAGGDLRAVNVVLDSLSILGSGGTNIGGALDEIGLELRAHGHAAEARAVFAQAIEWQRGRPVDVQRTPVARAALGNVLYDAESWGDARALYETLAREDTMNVAYLGTLGVLAVRRGDRAEATRIQSRLELDRPYLFGTNTYQRARIAALLGDRAGAVASLKQATSEGFAFTLAYHRAIDFESLRDYAPFRDFLRPKG